ncbi:MAG: hypothetical protein ACHBN1_00195 [Heteroscytonema crispum UTEX LB 1556]
MGDPLAAKAKFCYYSGGVATRPAASEAIAAVKMICGNTLSET